MIKLQTVKSTMIDDHIGYIRISQFSENTPEALKKQYMDLYNKGMDSVIIDLRNNPGGLLSSVVQIADLFLDNGTIVSTKGRNPSQDQVFTAHKELLLPELPMIVLVNEGSASASEIFAGAMKDNKRAIIVGEKTFGKGSVQTVRELPNGAGIRITTALYFTPSGKTIDKIGIEPDEVVHGVEITEKEMKAIDKINELKLIEEFVKKHPEKYTDEDFRALMKEIENNGIKINPLIVKRLIKNEKEKYKIPDLVDLEYDLQLKHAVNMLKTVSFFTKQKAS
ncbi:MAG: hypothetical protein DRP54_08095 [Spirochaetes bacterium]|nr:MAG: hypothetical protein DRP54_08095 [Spirochaetota bacterium]